MITDYREGYQHIFTLNAENNFDDKQLKRSKASAEDQLISKKRKLNEQNDFQAISSPFKTLDDDVISQMLDNAYYSKITLKPRDKISSSEKISNASKTALRQTRNDKKKADYHNCMARIYQNKGKYIKAFNEWEKLSRFAEGIHAFNKMGLLYTSKSEGIEKNLTTALKYFKIGAKKNDLTAAFNVALAHEKMKSKTDYEHTSRFAYNVIH